MRIKLPKKVRRVALISALSMKFKEERMIVLRDFPMEEIKTKKFQEVIDRFGFKKALFVIDESRPVLEKSSRNIRDVKMVRSEGINVYDLLKYDHVVLLGTLYKEDRRGVVIIMELHQIIKKTLITEKSTVARDAANQYNFEVDPRANRIEVLRAVEKLFKVKVLSCAGHECTRQEEADGQGCRAEALLEEGDCDPRPGEPHRGH